MSQGLSFIKTNKKQNFIYLFIIIIINLFICKFFGCCLFYEDHIKTLRNFTMALSFIFFFSF